MKSVIKNKLLQNLMQLDQSELQRFRAFVHSPFFHVHQPTIVMGDYLLDQRYRWEEVTKEELFQQVFPGESYQEFRVNNILSYLMDLFNRFLLQLGLERSAGSELYGLEAARDRGLHKLFWRNLRKAQKAYPDEDGWQGAHFRIQSALSFLEHDQLLSEEQQLRIEPLKAGVERLDITYLQQRLAQSCDLLTYSRLLKTPLDLGLLPDLLTYIEAHWQSIGTIPIIELYYHCARMNLHPEDNTHYEQMKEKLDQYEEGIGYRDRKNIYRQIFNHCIEKVNAGDVQFHRETLAIYKRLLRDDFVLQNGEIKQSTYNNIASLACTEGEVDWGEQFVRDYARYLAPEVRENAFASNLATIYFYQGKFSEALGLIHQVVFTNFYYQQKSRFLQVRIYYELGEEEPMLSALESFRILAVRNKKMLGAQRVAIQNFVRFTKALMKLFSERKTLRPARLHERAEDLCERILSITEPFFGKDWLLEKLRELTVY